MTQIILTRLLSPVTQYEPSSVIPEKALAIDSRPNSEQKSSIKIFLTIHTGTLATWSMGQGSAE